METINDSYFAFENVDEIIDQGRELEVIYGCDFEIIINENGTLSLDDMQGANLANICSLEFDDYIDILDRLEGTYLQDYGYMPR